MEGKTRAWALLAKHLSEGLQDSDKVFNSSLLLVLGYNLRELECLGLNNRLHSSELSQLLVNNNRNHQGPYLELNLLKLGLASAKIRVELSLPYSVSRQLDLGNSSSNPSLGSNSSRLLSLGSNSKHPHSGSNRRWVSSLNNCLVPNQLNKRILCLAHKLKEQVEASLELLQGLEVLLELQDSKSVRLPLTSHLEPVYSVQSQLDKDSLEQQVVLPLVSLAVNCLVGLNNNSKARYLEVADLQLLKNLSSVLNHLEQHSHNQANHHSLEIFLKDKVSLEVLLRPPVCSALRLLLPPSLEGNQCSAFLSKRAMLDPLPHPL